MAKTQVLEALLAYVKFGHVGKHAPKDRYKVAEQDWHCVGETHVGQSAGQLLQILVAESP